MTNEEIREKLFCLVPMWNHLIVKPFRELLAGELTLEMYSCIKTLEWADGPVTMSQMAVWNKTSKQQMTKLVNKLVEMDLVARLDDPSDRRVIKICLTDRAREYLDQLRTRGERQFQPLLEEMDPAMRREFEQGLTLIFRVFADRPSSRACITAGWEQADREGNGDIPVPPGQCPGGKKRA